MIESYVIMINSEFITILTHPHTLQGILFGLSGILLGITSFRVIPPNSIVKTQVLQTGRGDSLVVNGDEVIIGTGAQVYIEIDIPGARPKSLIVDDIRGRHAEHKPPSTILTFASKGPDNTPVKDGKPFITLDSPSFPQGNPQACNLYDKDRKIIGYFSRID